jgi:hypothetical protein
MVCGDKEHVSSVKRLYPSKRIAEKYTSAGFTPHASAWVDNSDRKNIATGCGMLRDHAAILLQHLLVFLYIFSRPSQLHKCLGDLLWNE